MKKGELERRGDLRLTEEDQFEALVETGGFDVLIGDPTLWPLTEGFEGVRIPAPEFSVSGRLVEL
jgi:hypothetical protein